MFGNRLKFFIFIHNMLPSANLLRCISDLLFYIMEVASLIANQISIAD
jgi:hypothetical protein